MNLLLKRISYIAIVLIFLLQIEAQATSLRVEKFSMPIKLANKISQPLSLSFSADGNWRLLAQVLDSRITNQDNPSYSIPITRLELAQLGGTPISNFDTGKIIEIKSGDVNGTNNMNLALNMINFDSDRPGNYVADVKFTLIGEDSTVAEDIYSFRFTKDEIASIDFSNRVTRLSFDKDKMLQKGSTQNLLSPVGVYVSCNKDWKLFARRISGTKDTTLDYFIKVLGGDQSVNCNVTSEYIHMTESPVLVATGKCTINDSMNCLDKKLINIDYQVKGPADKFIPAGSRSEEFEYSLETQD